MKIDIPQQRIAVISVVDRPKLKRDYKGRRIRILRDMKNGNASVPAGSFAVVKGYTRGASVKFDACPHCGVALYMSRLHDEDFEFIQETFL